MKILSNNAVINTADGARIQLTLTPEQTAENGGASLSLVLSELDGFVAASARATLDTACFAGEDSLCIELCEQGELRGYFASVLYSPYWCMPRFGQDFTDIPRNTQALLWRDDEGDFGVIFPVCSDTYKCTLASIDGKLHACFASYCDTLDNLDAPAFVCGKGEDPYALLQNAARAAARLSGKDTLPRNERSYPEIFEYLGWCSWDSMEIWVDEDGIREKMQELRDKNIPVRWGIVDDMWADVQWQKPLEKGSSHDIMFPVMHASKLKAFRADPARFPQGLGHTLSMMKNEFGVSPGIWHPVTGYWSGVTRDGELAKRFEGKLLKNTEDNLLPNFASYEDTYEFYDAFHTFIKESGAEFVKIDNQSCMHTKYNKCLPVGIAATNMHRAIEDSVDKHFGGALINCMGMAQENMFNRRASAISRASDDFQPENSAWFAKHITQCSYNSLIQGQFYYCDWDMWWSDDSQAVRNSVLRALSGGPVYVSDKIGRSRPEIFKPLCYSDGRILRCDEQLVPTVDCLYTDPTESGSAFKVFNRSGNAVLCAAFNIDSSERRVGGSICPADFGGLDEECDYILYEHFSGNAMPLSYYDEYDFTLASHTDCKLFILLPVRDGRAYIGLTEKFVSPAAIKHADASTVELYEGGEIALVSAEKIKRVTSGGREIPFERRGILYIVKAEKDDRLLSLEI